MKQKIAQHTATADPNDLARRCLKLVSEIADRGANSADPDQIGYALQELTQVLFERTGKHDRVFEPIPPAQITNLEQLHEELDFINSCSQSMMAESHLKRPLIM